MTKKILVVDDDAHVRRLLEGTLKRHGYACRAADSAAAAVTLLEEDAFDVAICDLNMPEVSGMELLDYIRHQHPRIAPVVLTGLDDPLCAETAIEMGAYAYLVKPWEQNELLISLSGTLRRLELEEENRRYQQHLEKQVAQQMQHLDRSLDQLAESQRFLHCTLDALTTSIAIVDESGKILAVNAAWRDCDQLDGFIGQRFHIGCDYVRMCQQCTSHPNDGAALAEGIRQVLQLQRNHFSMEYSVSTPQGPRWYTVRVSHFRGETPTRAVIAHDDMTEFKMLQMQLHHSQKLEAVGQLAAGVAHEINTPMQYIGDNTGYLQKCFQRLQEVLEAYEALGERPSEATPEEWQRVREMAERYQIASLLEEIPEAIGDSLQGIEAVARIVRALKELSHPGGEESILIDVNHAIETVVTVARNEWKYASTMNLDLDPHLPKVLGFPGELNQALLNIVVNAAHAVADATDNGTKGKGQVTITTRVVGSQVEIRIQDTGGGIPPEIRSRIMEPFFTTKPLGKGTGQGLAIAHSVIVQKHHGQLTFESEVGKGTTFIIRLPYDAPEATPAGAWSLDSVNEPPVPIGG